MTEDKSAYTAADFHVGCFGEFNTEDMICKRFCALRLRCAIECDQNARMEVIEDLISYENIVTKLQ